jgi:predicted metal-dependent phosphoesterase TrpH
VRIDLHAHTTASDGTDTPTQLVEHALAAGLDVVAITDHDTTAGWAEAMAAAPPRMTVVPGAEFSCVHYTGTGRRISMHVLGYLFDPDDVELRTERARLRTSRVDRARRIVELLEADDYPITWNAVQTLVGKGTVGRPHIGRALVDAGVVPSVDAAFRSVLSSRQPYYVPKADTPVLDAVRMIRAAGGLPVFAHPLARRRGPVVDIDVVAAMVSAGLVGIEVDHPDQDDTDRAEAAAWAAEFNLVALGSSDYHGSNKTVRLGECTTAPEAYERLLAAKG